MPGRIVFARYFEKNSLRDPVIRQQRVAQLRAKYQQRAEEARRIAREKGWVIRNTINGRTYELMGLMNGRPLYYQTTNLNAAISNAASLVWNDPPYYLLGSDVTVGLWDANNPRDTHQEFNGRITFGYEPDETYGYHNHTTWVAGAIGAYGVDSAAKGMAPDVNILSYDWTDDISEVTDNAAASSSQTDKIPLSNHSYGIAAGWATGVYSDEYGYGSYWFGTYGDREDEAFGQYGQMAHDLDDLCYDAQYFLPFWAAGNDRNDNAPSDGTTYYYQTYHHIFGWRWESKSYDSSTDPYDDGYDNGGYDTIEFSATGKNTMTVGAVADAVTSGQRDISKAYMQNFSGWGPTDDGRIKPDIVCNGTGLYTTAYESDTSYGSMTGTSMASPSAAGAGALLVEYYRRCNNDQLMLASTLKGLMIHTADDLGNAGPDYQFGWGLVNIQAAADIINDANTDPNSYSIIEDQLSTVNPDNLYTVFCDGTLPLRVTLCWTDPQAAALTDLDNTSSRLINDLDIRVYDANAAVYYPFVLNPNQPSQAATTGDNAIDNVEQVLINAPTAGYYDIEVTHKNSLTDNQQIYSVIISGQNIARELPIDRYEFDTIALAEVNVPLDINLFAVEANGATVTDFNGIVSLEAFSGEEAVESQVGSGIDTWEYPITVYYKKSRTQSIYLADEINHSGLIEQIAIEVNEVPGLDRNNWTIRMKQTDMNSYPVSEWDSNGWTTVYQANEPPGTTGWQYYTLQQPFDYNGVDHLMIDFSLDNNTWDYQTGLCYDTTTGENRSLVYQTDSDSYGPPTSWSGTSPTPLSEQRVPNIRLVFEGTRVEVPIDPNQTTSFIDGIWQGQVTLGLAMPDVLIRAIDDANRTGDSNRFDVTAPLPGMPYNPQPANDANTALLSSMLSWQCDSNSATETFFDIYLDTNSLPNELICADTNQLACDPNLQCSKHYYWQVVATNQHGSTAGPVWMFETESLPGDFDDNCVVDMNDLGYFGDQWLTADPNADIHPIAGDGIADFNDFAVLAGNWLDELVDH